MILESIKALQIMTFTVFDLDFPNENILSCCFFFFLIIHLYFLNPAVITQIFNPIAEVVIPIGTQTKEAKAEMEIHTLTVEVEKSKS